MVVARALGERNIPGIGTGIVARGTGIAALPALVGERGTRVTQVHLVGVALLRPAVGVRAQRRVVNHHHTGPGGELLLAAKRGNKVARSHGECVRPGVNRDNAPGSNVHPSVNGLGADRTARNGDRIETAVGSRGYINAHARSNLGGIEPRAHGVGELDRVRVVADKARRDRGAKAPVQVIAHGGVGGFPPRPVRILKHVLANHRHSGLGRNGHRSATHQREYRRSARLRLADGVLFSNNKPIPGGKLHATAGGNRLGLHTGHANRASEPRSQRRGHMPVGVKPLGNVLGNGSRNIHANLAQNRKRRVAHGIARPRHARCQLVPRAVPIGNIRAEELVRLVRVRDRTRHRKGAGSCGMPRCGGSRGRPWQNRRKHERKRAKKGDEPWGTKPEATANHGSALPSSRGCDEDVSGRRQGKQARHRSGT